MKQVSLPDYWWTQIVEVLEHIGSDSHGMTLSDHIPNHFHD